jgi:hypothetical protein
MPLNFLAEIKPTRELFYFSECKRGLHSFFKSPNRDSENNPLCRKCNTNAVNWEITKSKNIENVILLINELRKEWWRNYWWEKAIDETALAHANDFQKLSINVQKRIKSSVGRVYEFNGKMQPYRDGYQTPYSGNIIYYAQHAMATCCRYCIEYWHGIPAGRKLDDFEIKYLSDITFEYIKTRIASE